MERIITNFTDSDLYTFSVLYYILQTYPNSEVRYAFFDRNNTRYPKGFAELLQEHVNAMQDVVMTDEEVFFMKNKINYFPEWFYVFLKGYRFNPSEVHISQDASGYLSIVIEGKWWSTIMWEMPLLSLISELSHQLNGDLDKINLDTEYKRAYEKARLLLTNGIQVSDMGTRRRASVQVHDTVIRAFKDFSETEKGYDGKFLGTSNVYFAMKYDLTPVGTISHQVISFEECISGVTQCNNAVMEKWSKVYGSNLLTYLYDCFGDKVFFYYADGKYIKLYDGLRIDSGDNIDQFEKIMHMYEKHSINPQSKKVTFSNALDGETAIKLHNTVSGRMIDLYGIGTWLTCNFCEIAGIPALGIKNSNIVIKLVGMRRSDKSPWLDTVKLSCDKGKTLGNEEKCQYLLKQIG